MVGKREKSGRRVGPGNLRARVGKVEKAKGGKGLLDDRKYRVVGSGELVLGGKEVDWKVYKGFKKVVGGWENDEMRLEDEMVLDGSELGLSGKGDWEVWVDSMEGVEGDDERNSAEVVEEAIRELRRKEKEAIGEEKEKEVEVERVEEISESEKEVEKKRKVDKGKEKEVIVIESSGVEELGMLEKWKVEKKMKEKKERDESKKREKEGVINRGKDKGMGRDSTLELWREWKDYEELVEHARYILGIRKEEARCFMLDKEIRKVLELGLEKGLGTRKCGDNECRKEVEVRSEVVVEDGLKEKEELKMWKAVVGGRSYSEALKGGESNRRGDGLEEKKDVEIKKWLDDSLAREERSGKVVKVIMDSQSRKSKEEWKVEEVMGKLGISEHVVDKMKVVGNRVKMVMKDREVGEKIEGMGKVVLGEVIGGGVEEVKRNEVWVGIVVPGMEVDMWEGKMEMLKEKIEVENDIKLMRLPRWLANEERRKGMGLKRVGVVIHVARESIRVRLSEEGLKWKGKNWEGMLKVNRYIEERQLVFCTKCAMVRHNW
ncbi:hypothetical protein B9Z19DRAFT_1132706 [Tuber borchii]|uniref:Uncharacterized protein n=1 Tax=Tuber borchii TaxID=42251 RepID=A0A2T6ZH45_TUBBO|nr:hypothetical protein B9Z19DRAFT_1132706 [Tuber borchii]